MRRGNSPDAVSKYRYCKMNDLLHTNIEEEEDNVVEEDKVEVEVEDKIALSMLQARRTQPEVSMLLAEGPSGFTLRSKGI